MITDSILARARAVGGAPMGTPAQPLAVKAMASPPVKKSFSAHGAALVSRLNEDWPVAILSADAANRWGLRQLRARARDLERNGSIVTAYLDALEADIIGHRGIGLHAKIKEDASDRVITEDETSFYKALNAGVKSYRKGSPKARIALRDGARECAMKAMVVKTSRHLSKNEEAMPEPGGVDRYACYLVEKEFKEFSKRGNCDVTGKHSLMDLFRLSLRTSARDGDAVLLVYLGYPNRWGVAFQLIEGDYLDDLTGGAHALPNGNRLRGGVELDPFGRKVALWVSAHHPGDIGVDGGNSFDPRRRRIAILGERPDPYFTNGRPEAVQAIHLTRSKRAEETRAVPWMSHVMEIIRHIEVLKEAEITAARAEACKHKVYTRDLYTSDGQEIDWEESPDGSLSDEMQPAQAEVLPPGYKVELVDPKHPNPYFPDFLKSMKREVASGLRYCYNVLFGDLEGVSYSSVRAGLQMQREGSKMDQSWFDSDCVEPVVGIFIRMSILSGALPFRTGEFNRINDHERKFRRWPWVDPKNDAETAKLLLDMKVTTHGRIIADMSSDDFEATIDELADEEAYMDRKEMADMDGTEDPAGDDPSQGLHEQMGSKVGALQTMVALIEKLAPDKAVQALVELFGFEEEKARNVVALLGKPEVQAGIDAAQEAEHERAAAETAVGTPEPDLAGSQEKEKPGTERAVKSAFLGDVPLSDLPEHVQSTIAEFCPETGDDLNVTRYQMTVPELLDKADPSNLKNARRRIARRKPHTLAAEVNERKDKYVLLLNDRIVDGHHYLAKAERGGISRSLPVIDLTPLRHQ